MFNAPQRNALYNLVGEGVGGERAPIQLNFFRRGKGSAAYFVNPLNPFSNQTYFSGLEDVFCTTY